VAVDRDFRCISIATDGIRQQENVPARPPFPRIASLIVCGGGRRAAPSRDDPNLIPESTNFVPLIGA